ncbi:hypothetical protein E2I00_014579, partial [Balaenoptera physalus]
SDYKPRTMKYICSSPFGWIFRPNNFVFSQSGAGQGHRKEEAGMRDSIMRRYSRADVYEGNAQATEQEQQLLRRIDPQHCQDNYLQHSAHGFKAAISKIHYLRALQGNLLI